MDALCETKRYVILCVFKTNLLCVRNLQNALPELAKDWIVIFVYDVIIRNVI